jgi:hypothetical protein
VIVVKLYHGSKEIVKKPTYGLGKTNNDYGRGFYCTESLELASEWAVSLTNDGYANVYELDDKNLKILDLNNTNYCILHWLALLLKNRSFETITPQSKEAKEYILNNFLVDVEKYDVVIGYRADDSYFTFANDFVNGLINYNQLKKAMMLGELGIQIVLISKKAFNSIKYIQSIEALRDKYLFSKIERDKKARHDYLHSERMKRNKGEINIFDIIDEEMKENDPRLR